MLSSLKDSLEQGARIHVALQSIFKEADRNKAASPSVTFLCSTNINSTKHENFIKFPTSFTRPTHQANFLITELELIELQDVFGASQQQCRYYLPRAAVHTRRRCSETSAQRCPSSIGR